MEAQNGQELQSDKDIARELFNALKDDTRSVSNIDVNKLYSTQLENGKEIMAVGSFEEMKLGESLLKGMYSIGLEKPTLIQNIAVPYILSGGDVAFHSKSGTGKTIAFALGALQKAEVGKGPQVVILTPTRELSNQVGLVVGQLGAFVGVRVCLALRNFVAEDIPEEIVVGSPGKILGLTKSGQLKAENIKMIIFDEADELISQRSFSACSLSLIKALRAAQKVFFSATYSDLSQDALKKLVPKCQTFFERNVKADKIQLYYTEVDARSKLETLKMLFNLLTVAQTIVFVSTKRMADTLSKNLVADGFVVSAIHGDLEPFERDQAFTDFYQAKTKILVATDVISRGMDIPQVNLIINYDLPSYSKETIEETYIHRIGRSGRFNRLGFVIDFVGGPDDLCVLENIQTYNGTISRRFTLSALQEVFNEADGLSS
ncbi:ATP-dependent RNA helicase [Pancytospora philotis]|nr:ATP-dependent RNA helicase [Pancytospora philotis]